MKRLVHFVLLPCLHGGLLIAAMQVSAAPADVPTNTVPARVEAVRAAITDLQATFSNGYPRAAEFLGRLAGLEPRLQGPAGDARRGAEEELGRLQREALIANPLVCGQPILFVVRSQYRLDHHNTETMFQTGECNTGSYQPGGPLKVIDFARNGEVRTLVDPGPEGLLRDPDVHFDGVKIVFSMRRNIREDYHLYEVNRDGTGLKPLTSAPGVFDIDPLYLPDGGIAFTSSREPKYCMCNVHIMGNLFRMEGDGANIHQIGRSTLMEGHGALMPDGRILYYRWEYVDRNFGDAQGLWTVNPDGSNHAIYYGNNTPSPGAVVDARVVPGTRQVLCIFGSCHDRPWGALALLDGDVGVDGRAPVLRTWPPEAAKLVRDPGTGNGIYDVFARVRPKYEDPYPLSGKYFLCSRQTGNGEEMGLYLVDVFGNEVLLHREAPGCYDPMPLASRPRPPVIPARRNFTGTEGSLYVQNVYEGTHMQGVSNGAVRFLRVVESPEKRFWAGPAWGGQGVHRPGMNWHAFENKRILGTVPVEADGSAYFSLPSDRFVYFQALDENGMMIQSMRSGTMVQPGEITGCIGCHDDRRRMPAPAASPMTAALRRPPSRLEGWHGPARFFNYLTEVQPVFDRNCVRCHDFGKPAGEKLNLAGDKTAIFNVSYTELWMRGPLHVVGAGPAEIQKAYSWGSHASKLVQTLRNGHQGVKLSAEDFDRLVTWVDLNAPYYPSYATAYPGNPFGRSPLTYKQTKRLKDLGIDLEDRAVMRQVSFERPDLSPALATLGGPETAARQEALQILLAGQATLAACPDADRPGFVPCKTDLDREAKYQRRQGEELSNRKAIREGRKRYDGDPVADAPGPLLTGRGW
jgi:hypothetical protein